MNPTTLIFDLSETLIAGLLGVEKTLSPILHIEERAILPAFVGNYFHDLLCGRLSEDEYLAQIIQQQHWSIPPRIVKRVIRSNFHQRVDGMAELVHDLAARYELILLSDHAVEWIDYIRNIHPFLGLFKFQIFSFTLKQTKKEPSTFQRTLDAIGREPEQCLFVDDSEQNICSAVSVGIPSIRFKNAELLLHEFAAQGIR